VLNSKPEHGFSNDLLYIGSFNKDAVFRIDHILERDYEDSSRDFRDRKYSRSRKVKWSWQKHYLQNGLIRSY